MLSFKSILFRFSASLACILLINISYIAAQEQLFTGRLEASGGYITPDRMPFWLRSNQFGDVPLSNASMNYAGSLRKEYSKNDQPLWDWKAGINSKIYVGQSIDLRLLEAYAAMKLWIFEVKAGRSKEMMGLADSTLSVGSFALSGNAPGIPKIQAGIPEFYTLPFWGKMFAFKGNFVHGWLGDNLMELEDSIFPMKTYFHQKSLYGRLGKENWKVKLYGGFNHQVFWGNEAEYYGSDIYPLSLTKTYLYMITGTTYGNDNIPYSKIGNHLGTIDLGMEYQFDGWKLFGYRQNFFEVGALYYLANIRDGLNGLVIENTSPATKKGFRWEKGLLEIFYSKNQAGELWSPRTPSGDENYYNNFQYVKGWSYKDMNLGNPFIGTREYIRDDLPNDPDNYFINNRVIAFHAGFQGSWNQWDIAMKTSWSLNYGTYGTSEIGHSIGDRFDPPRHGIFEETQQFSAWLSLNYQF
ncbi:MAG: capsule assembly Wzi family protein, partial [Bacteroidota bacterium]